MNDVEELLRQTLTDQAASAPGVKPLAEYLAAEPRSRRPWRHWGVLAGVAAGTAAVVVAFVVFGSLATHGTHQPVQPGTSASPTGRPFPLTTSSWRPGDPAQQAAVRATLSLDGRGCLVVGGLPLVWPAGFTARVGPDGLVRVMNTEGSIVAVSGQLLTAGGGGALTPGWNWQHASCTLAYPQVFAIQDPMTSPRPGLVTALRPIGSGCQNLQITTSRNGFVAAPSKNPQPIDLHVGETVSLLSAGECHSLRMSRASGGQVLQAVGESPGRVFRAEAVGSERFSVGYASCEAIADPQCIGGLVPAGLVVVRVR